MAGTVLKGQYYVKRSYEPVFAGEDNPVLVRVSKVLPENSGTPPRIMHAHEHIAEVILITAGTGNFHIAGKLYRVTKGDMLVYNAGVIHDEAPDPSEPAGLFCAAFAGLRRPGLPENALVSPEQGVVFPSGDAFPVLKDLYEMIFRSLSQDEPQAEAFCVALGRALLVKALSVIDGAERPAPVEPDALAERIKAYIDARYAEPLTLQSIGEALHVSPYYVSHVFKKRIGYAPMQYLTRRRIGEAQTLLLETDLSVGQIAERVGYDTQNYFDQQFSKFMGMPPRRYRQNELHPSGGKKG